MKGERIGLRIDKKLKEKLIKISSDSKRKMSDYLVLLIEYAIKKKIKL